MSSKIPSFGGVVSKEESILEDYYCYDNFFQFESKFILQKGQEKSQNINFDAYIGTETYKYPRSKFGIVSNASINVNLENFKWTASVNERAKPTLSFSFPFDKRKIFQVNGEELFVRPGLRFKAFPFSRPFLKAFTANLAFNTNSIRGKIKASSHNLSYDFSKGTEFLGFGSRVRIKPEDFSIKNFGIATWLKEGIMRFAAVVDCNVASNNKVSLSCYFSQKIFENVDFAARVLIKDEKAVVTIGNEARYNKYHVLKAKASTSGIIGLALSSRILPRSTVNLSSELNILHPLNSKFGIKLNFRSKSTN